MKIAVISDIHSNFSALKTAYDEILSRCVDDIYGLGDLVGYGPQPRECINLFMQHKIETLLGNHDYALLHPEILNHFTIPGRKGIIYTSKVLTANHVNFLSGKKLTISKQFANFAHSSISSPASWFYLIDDIELIQENFDLLEPGIPLFIGHTHKQMVFEEKKAYEINFFKTEKFTLKGDRRYIINVGSVGQPRDDDPRLGFVIYDTDSREVEFVRKEYSIEQTAKKIFSISDLPDYLGHRLFRGD